MNAARFKSIRGREKRARARFMAHYTARFWQQMAAEPVSKPKRREWPFWLGFGVFTVSLSWGLWAIYSPCDEPNPPAYCKSCEGR